ncbi:guanylate kinase-associated protein mars [Drosophila obscura]|uniref:guanylate kinase-associated protein mars n=1 Tax=Drosophila obscura TaxID=7282 RepID=UPI001BB164F6|nr:guanylate kinase-associated protein mars [Drosophila obscura]
MQRYKDLYKQQSLALSPRNFNEQNRELQKAVRAKQREDRFQSNRIISVSPTPVKPAARSLRLSEEAEPRLTYVAPPKENQKPELAPQQKKPTRQDLYMKRFLDWKASKKEQTKDEQNTRRGQPLQSAPLQNSRFTHKTGTFKPPSNLQQEQENAPSFVPPKRHSLYVVVNKVHPTSTKNPSSTTSRPQPTISRPQTTTRAQPAATTVKLHPTTTRAQPAANTVKLHTTTTRAQPAATTVKPNPTTSRSQPKTTTTRSPPVAVKTQTRNLQPTTVKPAPSHALPMKPTPAPKPKAACVGVGSSANGVVHLPNVRTQPFEKPAVSKASMAAGRRAEIVKPKPIRGGGGAAGKFKPAAQTQGPAVKDKPASQFSMRMKAKSNTSKYVNLQKNVRNRPELRMELIEAATTELPPNTPLDERISCPALATSTQCKSNNCSDHMLEVFGDITSLSPVAPPSSIREADAKDDVPEKSKAKRKFDFSRYSVVESKAEESLILDPFLAKVTDELDPEEVTLKPAEENTPPRRISDGKPNYLSPFVSVSRGKVNSRCEREKRNSMYLPGDETPVAIRRAIESVLYFRIQLENEIGRLRAICSEWEVYSKENEAHLLDTGGMDMINVAIGQTNLLATKKMLQFSGLIDRCEAGATGKNHRPYDGSEATKPVQAEDLEGWWDMLRLQSENVDKRIDNLKRWKLNNWQDPDAVEDTKIPAKMVAKPKAKLGNNLKAKPKGKASSSLKQFLRKAHADMKKIKTDVTSADNSPPTPSRSSNQRVIVVRDRRSFSPARTVLRMSVGECRPSIGGNALLKTAILAAAEQNALNHTPPPNKARQSILKTPGTNKRESRGVIFSTKKNVRRFKFTFDEGTISDDEAVGGDKLEDCEEDMSLEASGERRSLDQWPAGNQQQSENGNTSRTYTLRNRRVRLRPSTEFM